MEQEVLDFIKRRWRKDANWTDGNCYWFARILCDRFDQLDIYYLPVDGHFVAGDGEQFYDFNGVVCTDEKIILFEKIKETDSLWYEHIVRDCVL